MLNGKTTIILWTVGLIKIRCINEWIFSKTEISRSNIKVELNFCYYAKKADLKNATGVDTSDFAKRKVI